MALYIYPGETFPLIVRDYLFDSLVEASQGMPSFGMIFNLSTSKNVVGIACHVYEKGIDEEKKVVKLKCKAIKRFIVLNQKNEEPALHHDQLLSYKVLADVIIQPDNELAHPLRTI